MLPSKIDQKKVSYETVSEGNFGFRHSIFLPWNAASEGSIFLVFGCSHFVFTIAATYGFMAPLIITNSTICAQDVLMIVY